MKCKGFKEMLHFQVTISFEFWMDRQADRVTKVKQYAPPPHHCYNYSKFKAFANKKIN